MAIDLFSLRLNIETSGLGVAKADLTGLETSGKAAALQMTNFSNAWTAAAAKIKASGAELAAFKAEFASGFFNEKMIAGMSLSGQEAAKLKAETDKVSQGFKNAGEQWRNGIGNIGAIASVTEGFRGAFEVVKPFLELWAAFKFVDFVHETLEAGSALHELSQKTGASVEMLSVLEFAGKRANVTSDQIAIGFRGLALSLGNLRDGQDKTVEAYQRLGFSAQSFQGLNADQAFIKVALAVGAMKDETLRAETAQRVFGRAGSQLLPLLEDLATNGFAKTREEAAKNGGIVTKEQAETMDKFTDAVGDLTKSLGGLIKVALIPMLGPLASIVGFLAQAVQHLRDLDAIGPLAFFKVFSSILPSTGETRWEGMTDLGPTRGTRPGDHGEGLIPLAAPKSGGRSRSPSSFTSTSAWTILNGELVPTLDQGVIDRFSDTSFVAGVPAMKPDLGPPGEPIVRGFGRGTSELSQAATAAQGQFATLGQNLGRTVADGFAAGLSNAIRGKNPFKAFGSVVLQGLGSIFTQMGHALLEFGLTMTKLLPFLTNIFTSGPAAIAAGIALTALGATFGGIVTGSGGGGGGGGSQSFDRTTKVTLVSDGAGGFVAPKAQPTHTYNVLGKDSPEGQRMFAEFQKTTARRGF